MCLTSSDAETPHAITTTSSRDCLLAAAPITAMSVESDMTDADVTDAEATVMVEDAALERTSPAQDLAHLGRRV